ncbi:MAG: hypothetical protein ABIU97_01775 [Dehalococcoidia bacterium]
MSMNLVLTTSEKDSALGQKLRAHFVQRLQEYRAKNDHPMDAEKRAHTLAEIKLCKEMERAFVEEPLAHPLGKLITDATGLE